MVKTGEFDGNGPPDQAYTQSELETLEQNPLERLSVSPTYTIIINLMHLAQRLLFNTTLGRFGFTSKGVQPGDLLCVLSGSPTPHVIRRVDDRDGEERYSFVGDAYVHDMMHGEVDGMDLEDKRLVFV